MATRRASTTSNWRGSGRWRSDLGRGTRRSECLAAVEQEGHWSVVDELDLHHGAEDAGGDLDPHCGQSLDDAEVQTLGLGGLGGLDEARPPAGAAVAEQGELA